MENPPSYEEVLAEHSLSSHDCKRDEKQFQQLSIRDEIAVSRSQHVEALVAKLITHIRGRARSGLSKSCLLLVPSDQGYSRKDELVGFPEGEISIIVQLDGQHDTMEFWAQREALGLLQSKMLAAISDDPTVPNQRPSLPLREAAPVKKSVFGLKKSKAACRQSQAPQSVEVRSDEVYFRKETDFGLIDTRMVRAIIATVELG